MAEDQLLRLMTQFGGEPAEASTRVADDQCLRIRGRGGIVQGADAGR